MYVLKIGTHQEHRLLHSKSAMLVCSGQVF